MKVQYRVSEFMWGKDRISIEVNGMVLQDYITKYGKGPSAQLMARIYLDQYLELAVEKLKEDRDLWVNLSKGQILKNNEGEEFVIESLSEKYVHLIKENDEEYPSGYFYDYDLLRKDFDLA